jgi:hypothetical protein
MTILKLEDCRGSSGTRRVKEGDWTVTTPSKPFDREGTLSLGTGIPFRVPEASDQALLTFTALYPRLLIISFSSPETTCMSLDLGLRNTKLPPIWSSFLLTTSARMLHK